MLLRWPHRLPLPPPQVQSAPAVLGGRAQLVVPPLLRLGECVHRPAQASPKRASMPQPSRPALPLQPSLLASVAQVHPGYQLPAPTCFPGYPLHRVALPSPGSSQGLRGFPHSRAPPGSPWVLS